VIRGRPLYQSSIREDSMSQAPGVVTAVRRDRLTLTHQFVLVSHQAIEPDRSSRMQLSSADTHLSAKAITIAITMSLIVIDTTLHHFVVSQYAHGNYFILLASEGMIVLMMKPIERAVEHYLLSQIIKRKRSKLLADV